MKKIFLFLLVLPVLPAIAQDLSYNYKTYEWSETLPFFTPAKTDTEFAEVILLYKQYTEFLDEDKVFKKIRLIHKLKYINDNKAVEDNNKIYLPVSAEKSLITFRSRVIKNGKVVSAADKADATVVEEEGQQYHLFALKGVEKGVMVETIMTMYLNEEVYDEDYLQLTTPVRLSEYTLLTPERLVFECKLYNSSAVLTDTIADERRVYNYSIKNIPAFNTEENYALANANKIRVEYSMRENISLGKEYSKFPEMGRNYFDAIHADFEKNEKELKKLLSNSKYQSFSTEDEKIVAIEGYIKTNIALEANAPGGQTVADMVTNKYAARYDYSKLMIQSMRKAGIKHEIVLTCNKQDKHFDPDFDSYSFLRDILIYFPSSGKFLDPQSVARRFGRLDNDHLGQPGLFVEMKSEKKLVSGVAGIKTIPSPPSSDNKDIEDYTVNFTGDLDGINISYHREMNNYADNDLKAYYYFRNEEERKNLIESFLHGYDEESRITDVQVKNYDLTRYDEIKKPFTIEANIASSHFNEKAGDKILFRVGELIGPQVEMFQDKPRQNPVDIENNHSYIRKIVINIPDGYQVKGLDKLPLNLKIMDKGNDLCGFVTTYELKGSVLTINNTEYYNALHYEKAIFEDFRRVINASAEFNKISLLIEKK